MRIDVTSNFKELAKDFDPVIIDKASVATVNALASQSRTMVNKELKVKYTVKTGDLKKQSRIDKANKNRIIATIISKGKRIALAKFKSRQVKSGTTVSVIKGRSKTLVHAFKQTMPSGHVGVFFRAKAGSGRVPRLPIDELFGPSYPQMMESATIMAKVNKLVADKVQPIFNNAIDYYYNKQGGQS